MTITIAQVFLLTLAVLVMILVGLRYRQKRISTLSFFLWLPLWGAAAIVILFPNTTMVVAEILGIGRGADLVIYLSIIMLLYLIFRVVVRIERMDKEITKIVRAIALREWGAEEEQGEHGKKRPGR